MNQKLIDDLYGLRKFRDALTRAMAGSQVVGLILKVPETVRVMAAKTSPLLIVEHVEGTNQVTVRRGPEAHFIVSLCPNNSYTVGLVHEPAHA